MVYCKNSIFVSQETTEIILEQMKKCICTLGFNENEEQGTGFFCIIPYKRIKLKVLITADFVIENQIKRDKIKIKLNDKIKEIKINDDRKIYLNEEYRTAIIEINPSKDGIDDFLELDENFIKEISEESGEKGIYILQSLDRSRQGKFVSCGNVINFMDSEIVHLCSTWKGSAGSPILNIKNNKVIGIHWGSKNKHSKNVYNVGTFLDYVIKDFNNDNHLINLYNDKSFSNLKLISAGSYGDVYSAYSIKDKFEV